MGKRPSKKGSKEPRKFISPEIEIISKPELERQTFTDTHQGYNTTVTPTEVLPAVGKDSSAIAKKIRTKDIQNALAGAGLNPGPIDGKVGPQTKKAIREFQKTNHLYIDGIVGQKTWEKLKPFLTAKTDNLKN